MSLQDKILKRKLKKKEKQKLKIIEERKANPTIESTEEESEQQNEITESDVENHGTKRKIEDSDVEPVKKSKKKKKSKFYNTKNVSHAWGTAQFRLKKSQTYKYVCN